MTDRKPLFAFTDHFDTSITIGDVKLPIHVRRLDRAQLEAFEKNFAKYYSEKAIAERNAMAEGSPERDERNAALVDFTDREIRANITLDAGLITDNGNDVTTGDGLIAVFHSRGDVLSGLLVAILTENRLSSIIRKNSNSPRASASGSVASIPTRGGAEPGPTAASAESLSTANPAPATEASALSEESPLSSGAIPAPGEESIH